MRKNLSLTTLHLNCQEILARYLDSDHVVKSLLEAENLGLHHVLQKAELINKLDFQVELTIKESGLEFYFLAFTARGLELFQSLKGMITNLKYGKSLTQEKPFSRNSPCLPQP